MADDDDAAADDLFVRQFKRLSQQLISQAALLTDSDAKSMIVLLSHVFASAVQQITEQSRQSEMGDGNVRVGNANECH